MADYTPGGGKLDPELSDALGTVNEAIKAGHQAGVFGCDLQAAAGLDLVCRALERATQADAELKRLREQVSSAYTGICPYCEKPRGGTMKGRLENPYCASCLHERIEGALHD